MMDPNDYAKKTRCWTEMAVWKIIKGTRRDTVKKNSIQETALFSGLLPG